jgi:hypothetical protein
VRAGPKEAARQIGWKSASLRDWVSDYYRCGFVAYGFDISLA